MPVARIAFCPADPTATDVGFSSSYKCIWILLLKVYSTEEWHPQGWFRAEAGACAPHGASNTALPRVTVSPSSSTGLHLFLPDLYRVSQECSEVGWLPPRSAGWLGLDVCLHIQEGGSGLQFHAWERRLLSFLCVLSPLAFPILCRSVGLEWSQR